MTNAELLAKIKAEIERLRSNMDDRDPLAPNQKAGYLFALADVLSFLSTLESEKPMQEGLEEEIERYLPKIPENPYNEELRIFARHFYDLGCRRTAEKYDEIEYNRQREEECLADASKTLAIKPGDEVTINGHKIIYDKDKGYVTIVKSEESVPNDLEKAADEYSQKEEYMDVGFCVEPVYIGHKTEKAFIAGAKWQKEHDAELIEIAYNDGITIGMTKQKEQMMKDTVDGEVCIPNVWVEHKEGKELVVRAEISKELGFKFGDKVRVIVLKKED